MIEVQDAQVAVSAIDTRMLAQIGREKLLRLDPALRRALDDDADVLLAVRRVIPTGCCPIAVAADLLESVRACGLSIELRAWLRLPTSAAHLLGYCRPP
jgi:hypothetical protein